MNQEEFRSLLSKPGAASSSRGAETSSRGSKPSKSKSKAVDSSQPAFKPRKVKPEASTEGGKYRDRATERRLGKDGDFAHVEAVLSEFEKRAQDGDPDIEEKRKYLGGDSEHSVLVKGLDFALLEQNKARLAAETDVVDDDTLEQAFTEVVAKPPKKRTREDLIRELKEKRGGGASAGDAEPSTHSREEEARVLEEAKQQGKFKPIGFKPIGESEGKKKKKKGKEDGKDGERKKKKRKVEGEGLAEAPVVVESQVKQVESEPTKPSAASAQPPPEPEPTNDDFDIFADAGEYTGLDIDEEEDEAAGPQKEEGELDGDGAPPRRWIDMDEDPVLHRKRSEPPRLADEEEPSSAPGRNFDEDMEVDERPMRLAPLESSALPDIKELLQMDKASSSWSKNKKKKDKKKATGGGDEPGKVSEAKIERDYQRLKAYTDKKK